MYPWERTLQRDALVPSPITDITPLPRPNCLWTLCTATCWAGLWPAPQMAPDRMAACQSWICFPLLQVVSMVYVLLCWGVFFCSHTVLPMEHSLGVNFFFSSLSSCKCCTFLPFPVFLFCLPRCHMYVVYVWTGWWLISLVLVTSDNKGLLLLLLLLLKRLIGKNYFMHFENTKILRLNVFKYKIHFILFLW